MVRLCKEFGQLPFAGGLYAQPYGHILRMEAVLDAIAKVEEAEYKRMEARQRAEERAKQVTPDGP
jgi:hypothetical protein